MHAAKDHGWNMVVRNKVFLVQFRAFDILCGGFDEDFEILLYQRIVLFGHAPLEFLFRLKYRLAAAFAEARIQIDNLVIDVLDAKFGCAFRLEACGGAHQQHRVLIAALNPRGRAFTLMLRGGRGSWTLRGYVRRHEHTNGKKDGPEEGLSGRTGYGTAENFKHTLWYLKWRMEKRRSHARSINREPRE